MDDIKKLKARRQEVSEINNTSITPDIIMPRTPCPLPPENYPLAPIYKSKILNLNFNFQGNNACFEDGSLYTEKEINLIHGLMPDDIKIVHKIKVLFKGTVIDVKK